MAFNYRGGSSRSQNEKFTWKPDKKIQDTHKDTFSDFGVETSEPWNQSQQKQQDAWEMSSEEYAARQQNQISWTGETNEELKQRSQNSKQTRDGFQRGGWRERKKQQDANERRTFVAGQNYQSVSIDINGPQQPNSYPDEIDSMTCFCPVRSFQIEKIYSLVNEQTSDVKADTSEIIPDGLIFNNDWQLINFPIFNEMQPNGLYSLFSYALLFAKLQIKELYDKIIAEKFNSEDKTLKIQEMQIDSEVNLEIKNDREIENDKNIQIEQSHQLPSNANQQSESSFIQPLHSSSSSQGQQISQQLISLNEKSFNSPSPSMFIHTSSITAPNCEIFGLKANPPSLPIYLPPMSKTFRKTLHKCAEIFGLIAHSHGKLTIFFCSEEGVRHIVLNFPNICDINGNIIQMNQDGKRIFGIRTLKIPSLNEVLRSIQDFDESGFLLNELFESTATFPRYFTNEQKQRHIFARRLHCLQNPQYQLPKSILQSTQWADQLIAGLERIRPKRKDIVIPQHEQSPKDILMHSNQQSIQIPSQQQTNCLDSSFQLPISFSDRLHPPQTQSYQNISTFNYSTIMQLFEIYFDCLPIELRVSFRLLSALEQCLKQGRKILEVNGPQLFAGRQWQSAGQQDIEAQINSMFLQQSSSIQQQSQISSNFKDIINNDFINDSNAGLGFVKNQKNLEEKEEQIMEKDDPDSVNNDKSADSGIQNNEIWKGSVGLSLMMKFGWNGQDGIGLHQGIKQPIDVTIRKGKEGIGHNKYE